MNGRGMMAGLAKRLRPPAPEAPVRAAVRVTYADAHKSFPPMLHATLQHVREEVFELGQLMLGDETRQLVGIKAVSADNGQPLIELAVVDARLVEVEQ